MPPSLLAITGVPGIARRLERALAAARVPAVVHRAGHAVAAFEWLKQREAGSAQPPPDAVLLDLRLPVLGGAVVLEVLRHHDSWTRLPVVVLADTVAERALGVRYACTCAPRPLTPAAWADLAERLGQALAAGPAAH